MPVAAQSSPAGILVLIPAHNEEGRIQGVIRELRKLDRPLDIVVVDDGSTDRTREQAKAMGAVVLRHAFNLGYGAALQTGYLYAQRRGCRLLVQMDADGRHDAGSVEALVAAIEEGADLVLGSRFGETTQIPHMSRVRRLGSRLFALIVTKWTGVRVTDPTSGYQAMSARAIARVAREGFPDDYPDADVLILLAKSGLNLVEVPVTMHPRAGGVSMHRGTRIAFYAYKMFLSLALLGVRRPSPYRAARGA